MILLLFIIGLILGFCIAASAIPNYITKQCDEKREIKAHGKLYRIFEIHHANEIDIPMPEGVVVKFTMHNGKKYIVKHNGECEEEK